MAPDKLDIVAPLAGGAHDPCRIRSVAADIGHLDPRPLHLVDQVGVVIGPGRIGGVQGLAHAALAQPAPCLVRQAGTVGAAVAQDGDLAARPTLGQEVGGDLALPVVAADQPKDVAATFLGQPRVARGGGQHRHAGLLVNRSGHQRGMRAEMADHQADAGSDQLVRGRLGLLDIAGIVGGDDPNRLAEHSAVSVQPLDRDLDRFMVAGSGRGIRSGEGTGEAEPDFLGARFGAGKDGCNGEHETEMPKHGARLPLATVQNNAIRPTYPDTP